MVVEKAYAKLHGGDGALEGGTIDAALALVDGKIKESWHAEDSEPITASCA